jgi:prepilin-type N-terminal cleavage/methylation domain-containing protein
MKPHHQWGFTLVEVLTATAILGIITIVMALMVTRVSNIWINSRGKISVLQNGRAVLDFMARDLRRLAAPQTSFAMPTLHPDDADPRAWNPGETPTGKVTPFPATPLAGAQFLQDVDLASLLPEDQTPVPNSSNLFGQFRGKDTVSGNLWLLGYYLAENRHHVRRLYRLAVSPADHDGASPKYKLNATTITSAAGGGVPWLVPTAFDDALPLGDNVAAFYIVCLDRNRRPIPWLSMHSPAAAPLKFDSAAAFVMSAPAADGDALPANSFAYLTAANAFPAHQLPAALRVTILTVDPLYRKRGLTLPPPPVLVYDADHDYDLDAIRDYQRTLAAQNITSAQLFTLNIELNGERL